MVDGEITRVCILSKMFPPSSGGAETYAYELADGLGKRGYDVDVYTQWVEHPNETVDIHENVTVHRICKARKKLVTFETLWFSLVARWKIDFESYDIIHGTLMPASVISVAAMRSFDTPIVLTSHGTSIDELAAVTPEIPTDYLLKYFFHPMNIAMDYIAGEFADDIIAISKHAHDRLVNDYNFDKEQVHMIPHGTNVNRFYPREESHPEVDSNKLSLLYIGRLAPRKGVGLALEAFAEVDQLGMELLIGGKGQYEERLQRLATDLGINDQVQFLGYVPDEELPLLYSSADLFLLPSRYEGFGLVLLESVASGTPVIGADVGGVSTAIDGDYGIVFERNVEAFANAIESAADEGTMRRMRKAAIDEREQISWNKTINRVINVYKSK